MKYFILLLILGLLLSGCERKPVDQVKLDKQADFILKCISTSKSYEGVVEQCRMTGYQLYGQ